MTPPFAVVVPAPLIEPPLQLVKPLTVTVLEPVRVPAVIVSAPTGTWPSLVSLKSTVRR